MTDRTSTTCQGCRPWPPYRARMAAPPDSTKVSPAMPRNSASSRRSRWSGLVQSAYPRAPPTEAISAALPTGSMARPGCAAPASEVLISGFLRARQVSRTPAGQRERVDHPVVQVLAHALGQRRLLQGQVVVDGVVGDLRGLVVPDDRGQR